MKLERELTVDISETEVVERARAYLKPNWYRRIEGLPVFRRPGLQPGFPTPASSPVEIKLSIVPQDDALQVKVTLENGLPGVDPGPGEDSYWRNVLNAVVTSIRTGEALSLEEDTRIRAVWNRWRLIFVIEFLICLGGAIASQFLFDSFWLESSGALPGFVLVLLTAWYLRKRRFKAA